VALTLLVVSSPTPSGADAEGPPEEPPALSFDMPRLVIGRSDGCDLRLPDPSVSHRHCSIRQRGAEHVLVDEGSTNGTFLERIRLAPQSPQPLRDGDRFRVGRVWLEMRRETALVSASSAAHAKALALRLVTAGLAVQGEDARPRVTAQRGPDAGKELVLDAPGRRYVLGRARDADLVLEDEIASRRHVDVELAGDHVIVHDLGSKLGATIDGAAAAPTGTAWRPGQTLSLGSNHFALVYEALEVLGELERSPDEKIPNDEVFELPARAAPAAADAEGEATPDGPPAARTDRPREPAAIDRAGAALGSDPAAAGKRFGFTEVVVILVAIGILLASAAGLWLLLRG
jgi:pSer/pThr/pTyr-binding forkhead associated (FHA) protein